jgi:uncharacterized protein (DUF1501 family)
MGHCKEYGQLTRRQLLQRGSLAGLASLTMPAWMPRLAFAQGGPQRDVVIVVFLRGGVDGLSLCYPFGDADYYVHRTSEAIPRPDSTSNVKGINLDGFFGVPRALSSMVPIYNDGKLLFVHATGGVLNTYTRSHFDAMRWLELGKPDDISVPDGWLARHLASTPSIITNAPLRGISITYGQSESLRAAPLTLPIPDPRYFGYDGWYPNQTEMINWLKATYNLTNDPIKAAAKNTTNTVDLLKAIDFENYVPAGGAVYNSDNSDFHRSLRSAAAIMRAQIGVEVITIDIGGWDSHNDQGTNTGYLHNLMTELATGLSAFYTDLHGANQANWTLVAMSEFGRTAVQNATGTDHGRGNAMMLMGPNVIGGRVVRDWPGLAMDNLVDQQDLNVTIDYRDVISEVVKKRMGNNNIGVVLPGYTPNYRGLVSG